MRITHAARHRRQYVLLPSSSTLSSAEPPVEMSMSVRGSGVQCAAGLETLESGRSMVSSICMCKFEWLGYFGAGTGRVPGTEKAPNPRGEVVVFKVFFRLGFDSHAIHS